MAVELSSITGLKHLKSKPTTCTDHFCNMCCEKSKVEQYLHSMEHFLSEVATSKQYYCNMC
jgi:hypothetical protein